MCVVTFPLILLSTDGISTAYEKTSAMIMFCHLLMLAEILHAALGMVKGGVLPTLLQVFISSTHHHT